MAYARRQIKGKFEATATLDRRVFDTPRKRKEFSNWLTSVSFGCPTGMDVCGRLDEIVQGYSSTNVFLAIPYSRYTSQEAAIRQVMSSAMLNPVLAKDRIRTMSLLCKICKEMRKCAYMVADISRQNANVAYELGLMQSFGKQCAILFSTRVRRQKPSDLAGIEDVRYSTYNKLKKELGKWIRDNVPEADKKSLRAFLKSL